MALVLVAGGVASVVLFAGDKTADRPDMAVRADAREMAFPDLAKLGYDSGPEAVCDAVAKAVEPRGYQLFGVSSKLGVNCMLCTPGTSMLEDGSVSLNATVFVIRGDQARTADLTARDQASIRGRPDRTA